MFTLLLRSPVPNLARYNERLRPLPMRLTFSVSYRSNSRCQTGKFDESESLIL